MHRVVPFDKNYDQVRNLENTAFILLIISSILIFSNWLLTLGAAFATGLALGALTTSDLLLGLLKSKLVSPLKSRGGDLLLASALSEAAFLSAAAFAAPL